MVEQVLQGGGGCVPVEVLVVEHVLQGGGCVPVEVLVVEQVLQGG